MKLLAVYGSLRMGMGNDGILTDPSTRFLGEEQTSPAFTMIDLGAYPGVVNQGDTPITIEVYGVSEDVWRRVEHLEGYPDYYDRIPLETSHGRAEMYVLPGHYLPQYRERIVESGDWTRFHSERREMMLNQRLNRQ
jgi:gamma-glutamylcyclotransferase (GGCT)/AIG2-like uncharacterized protein YtfP